MSPAKDEEAGPSDEGRPVASKDTLNNTVEEGSSKNLVRKGKGKPKQKAPGKKKPRKGKVHPEKQDAEDINSSANDSELGIEPEDIKTDKEKEKEELTTDDAAVKKRKKKATVVSLFSNAGRDIEIVTSAPADGDDEKLPQPVLEDLDIRNRNTWSVETFEATTERIFQGKFLSALRPYIQTLIFLGRFPLSVFMKDEEDANPYYQIMWSSSRSVWCLIVSIFNFTLCLWTWMACFLFFADSVHGSGQSPAYWKYLRSHESLLIKRNITTFVMFNVCIVHLFLTHLLIFYKKNFNCQYSTLWLESVELLRLHCVAGIRNFFWWKLGLFIFFTAIVIILFSVGFHVCQGTGAMIGVLLLRLFAPKIVTWSAKEFHAVRVFGIIIFVYVLMLAKFSAIQFAIRCRLINNLIGVWNRRFRVCLHGTEEEQKQMIRSSRAYLFKDHCVWVNILEGANKEIFLQIESFYVMVCVSLVYELHHVVRSIWGEEFDDNRTLDWIPCMAFLVIDLHYFYTAGIEAGLLTETVNESYEVVRDKGVLSKKADQEVTFMMSLQLSLMGSTDERGMGLVGWEFVYYSKTFMLVALGFSVTFFVMLWQYQQPLDQFIGNDIHCDRVNVREFLDRVMQVRSFFPEDTHLSSCHGDYQVYYDKHD